MVETGARQRARRPGEKFIDEPGTRPKSRIFKLSTRNPGLVDPAFCRAHVVTPENESAAVLRKFYRFNFAILYRAWAVIFGLIWIKLHPEKCACPDGLSFFRKFFARGVCIALQHYLEWGNGRLTPRIPPINSSLSSWRTLSHQIPLKPPKTLRKQISAKSNLILPTGCTCRTIV